MPAAGDRPASRGRAAIQAGGGVNHRGYSVAVLVKDNLPVSGYTAVSARHAGRAVVEVECDSLEQVQEAKAAGADMVPRQHDARWRAPALVVLG